MFNGGTMYALQTTDGRYATIHNSKPMLTPNARLAYVWKTQEEAQHTVRSFSTILKTDLAVVSLKA
jgi:coproporphyrinogen III oxidase